MIASSIGKMFLNAYNEKVKAHYSAKEFFVEVYHKLFYDHNKYMMSGGNSDLENPKISWGKMLNGLIPYETKEERVVRLNKLIQKITTTPINMSTAIGFPALGVTATTSGQITNMALPFEEEEVYLSWIGSGFGVGVEGGLSMLFSNVQILLDLFEGWTLYRQYLDDAQELKGNQINTWNGQWLAHRYNKNTFDPQHPTASFQPFKTTTGNGMELDTQSWAKVLVGIARNFPDSIETAYVYSLGQTNVTIGFVPFELPKIRQPYELYEKYFGTNDRSKVENLFGTAHGFTKACQMGAIGVNALEPKGFRDSLGKGIIPTYNNTNEEKRISFNTYQIWLLAMLNNEQLWEHAQQIAITLSNYAKNDAASKTGAKTKKSREVDTLLAAVNKKQFIDGLTTLVEQGQEAEQLAQIAAMINLMPVDNVPYFLTLIRFQHAVISKKS
jgi:hypothetical protein